MRFLAKILSVACWFWVGVAAVTPNLAAKGTIEEQQAEVRTMRDQVHASPLCGGPAYAETIGTAFRDMWQTWVETGGYKGR